MACLFPDRQIDAPYYFIHKINTLQCFVKDAYQKTSSHWVLFFIKFSLSLTCQTRQDRSSTCVLFTWLNTHHFTQSKEALSAPITAPPLSALLSTLRPIPLENLTFQQQSRIPLHRQSVSTRRRLLIDSRCQTTPPNAEACWWMAPASPQRKSIEVMGGEGVLKHLHMAGEWGWQRESCQPSV